MREKAVQLTRKSRSRKRNRTLEKSGTKRKKQKKTRYWRKSKKVTYLLFSFLVVSLLFFWLCSFFVLVEPMAEIGMKPELAHYHMVLIIKKKTFKRSDMVLIRLSDRKEIVRRVIGVPGDRLNYRNGQLFINDEIRSEHYIDQSVTEDFTLEEISGKNVIPKNTYFVLADDREDALDSRHYGLIPVESIVGKIDSVFFSSAK